VGSVAAIILLIGAVALAWRHGNNRQTDSAGTAYTTETTTRLTATGTPPPPPPAAAPPAATTTPTNDPALTGPAEGSDCAHAQVNVVTTSSSGTPIVAPAGQAAIHGNPTLAPTRPTRRSSVRWAGTSASNSFPKRNALRPQQPSSILRTPPGRCSLRAPMTSRTRCHSVPMPRSRGREAVAPSTSTTAPESSTTPAPTPMPSISQS
jgi:hypothetical protein